MKKISSLIIVLGLILLNFRSIAEAITYTFTPINFPGASSTGALGINDSNNIVGYYDDATGLHGFLDVGGNFTPMNFPGAYWTGAYAINDSNNIVGFYSDGAKIHGFLDVGGNFTPINFPSAYTTYAFGINDSNNIVGIYPDGTGWHGFVASPIPEPSTMLLLSSGLIGLAGYGRKKFFKK